MNTADAVKDVVRIATTAGLAKDVVDLLEKKAALMAEKAFSLEQENTTLLRENRNLHLVNKDLKRQLENARPKGDELEEGCVQMLIAIAHFDGIIRNDDIFQQLGFGKVQGDYWMDQLTKRKFVDFGLIGSSDGCAISATSAGREYLSKKGLLNAKPNRPLVQRRSSDHYGGHGMY
jgi:hypothetical protein